MTIQILSICKAKEEKSQIVCKEINPGALFEWAKES